MKYRLILAEEAHHEVSLMCRVLGVSRAGYYAWKNRGESRRQREDAALAEKIRAIHSGSRGTYGSPRVHAELRQGHGVRCSRKRVARLMREHDLVGVHRRRRRCLTKQDTQAAPAPDLLGRDFTAERPGEKLVGDITYLPTEEGWLYLATVLDLATRKVVGYSMAEHLRAELVCDAIRAAAGRGALAEQAIFHSDRGTQYTSAQFRTLCGQLGVRQSMGRVGSCFDNAVAESFFASLKTEIGTRIWRTRAEARAAVFEWIAVHYNRRRRHSSIGYLTPRRPSTAIVSNRSRHENHVSAEAGEAQTSSGAGLTPHRPPVAPATTGVRAPTRSFASGPCVAESYCTNRGERGPLRCPGPGDVHPGSRRPGAGRYRQRQDMGSGRSVGRRAR